jgi:hypothetical protein
MARTRRTTRKSTGRLPIGQLAPGNVPRPQESQPDIPQEASREEEPFEIELVVPESPTAQDSPAEEQQPEDHDIEDKTNKEHPSRQALSFAGTPRHNHRSSIQDQGSPAFGASRVQGHRRDFLQIQDPLLTQGTSFQDFSE